MKPDEPDRDVLGIDKAFKRLTELDKMTPEERKLAQEEWDARPPDPKKPIDAGWAIYRWVLIAIFLSAVWCGIVTGTWWVVVGGLGCAFAMWCGR